MHEYPSFIAGLDHKGVDGFNRAQWCSKHLMPGDRLILRPEPDNPVDPCAVTISPAQAPDLIIGYIPRKHSWVNKAIVDDRLLVDAIVDHIDEGISQPDEPFQAQYVKLRVRCMNAAETRAAKAASAETDEASHCT